MRQITAFISGVMVGGSTQQIAAIQDSTMAEQSEDLRRMLELAQQRRIGEKIEELEQRLAWIESWLLCRPPKQKELRTR